ncbi:MAG: hypothetical protein OXB91_08695 [Bryobacterales bacterium]|nr:hypothetical protein [Bryobacterales bacterium]
MFRLPSPVVSVRSELITASLLVLDRLSASRMTVKQAYKLAGVTADKLHSEQDSGERRCRDQWWRHHTFQTRDI